ncbi:MAG TPA: discoidin domain-containing protein, partial [Polyangiaceae bacterium]|nr:discoidin domain-containing protein [Polyangiaceae bacterium]
LGCVIAPLLACSLGYGALVSALFGLTTLFIYWNFVVQWSPVYSSHFINWRFPSMNSALPAEFGALTVLCWFALGAAAVHLLRPTLPAVWPHPLRFARPVRAGDGAGPHSSEDPGAASVAAPATPGPSSESSTLARLGEWFSRRRALGTALDLAGTPERREWRRRARLAFDHATRVHEPAEPFGLGASPVVASELYREACYWAIAASSDAVTSLPSREQLLGALDRTLVKRALESDEAVERFQASLARPWFGDYANDAPGEQALAAAELARGARALVEAAELPERKIETLRAQRLLRFAAPVVVLAALALFVPPIVSDWLDARHDLAAGKRWRTSSQWGAPCDPERGRCAGVTGTRILFHTNEESSPWVEFDLGKETFFSTVKVRNRTDCCQERAAPLVLELSHDRQKWREIARRNDPFETWTAHFAPKRARYVRARVLGRSILHLERVTVLE